MRPVIIALDFPSQVAALEFLAPFRGLPNLFVKVGMELFYTAGPAILAELRQRGIQVFLDLKCYDIPHTVEQTMRQLGRQGVALTTIHAAGGADMIAAAKRGLLTGAKEAGVAPAKLLAVTQLTSTTAAQMQREQLVTADLPTSVRHLARLAWQSGADGVIASALEDPTIHAATAADFWCINPGIRLENDAVDDQKRVVTPGRAAQLGSDGLVVGRSITQASDPVAAYQRVLREWGVEA